MKKCVVVLWISLFFTASVASAGTITSIASGNWNSPSIWSTGAVPAVNDDVVIGQGTIVTLNVNSPAVRTITILSGATLQGDGTGKILLAGKGGGEDFTNNGIFDATGAHAATVQLFRPMQWGGSGAYNCSFIDLSFRNLTFTIGTNVTVHLSGSPDPFLNPGGVIPSSSVTLDYDGSAAQNISASANVGFNGIAISNPAGVTLQKNLTSANFTGNLTINNGAALNTSGGTSVFNITGGAGNTFAMAANALLVVGSTATAAGSFPGGFSTFALDETSTVQYNNVAAATQNVSLTPVYGNLLLSGSGTISLGPGTVTLAGNWMNNAGGIVQCSGSNVVSMSNGTVAHTIGGSASTSFQGLTVNSAPGVSLALPTTVGGVLNLTNGVITTGTATLTVTSGGSVSRTSGYVNGKLVRYVAAGSPALTFDIGDASNYTPVTLSFAAVSTPGNLTAQTFAGDHPGLSSSLIDGSRSVNRYWRLVNGGVAFTSATGTFSFAPGDIDAGADPSSFSAGAYDGAAWTPLAPGTRSSTSTELTGIGFFGDFAIGNLITHTITATADANGGISPAGSVTVTHGQDQAFTLTANTGYHIGDVTVDGVSQGAVSTYSFTNVTADHTIDVSFAIDHVTVSATVGANGSIAPSGNVSVPYNGSQAFEFLPSPGYHVDSVIVDGVNQFPASGHAFNNVVRNHTLRVTFALNQFTITASSGPNGTIVPSGVVTVDSGSSQAFSFTPATGYHVDSLIVDGSLVPSASGYTFTDLSANHTIYVSYAIDQFSITASAGTNGSISPSGTVNVDYGGSQVFTFTPSTGYHVDSLVVDGAAQPAAPGYTFTNVVGNHTIHVTFAINGFVINAGAGAHGTISPSGAVQVAYGADQAFTFAPDTGYYVSSLHVDSVAVAPSSQYTFVNVTANHTIDVQFAAETFTIHATSGLHGNISPAGNIAVNFGASQTFSFTADTGYYVAALHVDTSAVPPAPSYTFTNVRANHAIDVQFALQYFVITASAGAHGSISPSGAVALPYGASQNFVMTPDSGWAVAAVVVDSVPVGAVSSYKFENIVRAHMISVVFQPANHAPAPALLVTPLNRDTVNVDSIPSPFLFGWHRSVDPDSADTVRYVLHVYGTGMDTTLVGLSDTVAGVELAANLHAGSTYYWTVAATDGHVTVASADTFAFTIRFASGVKGRLDRMPKAFALYQNYPNPFNPTTTIEYDVPRSSVVTITIYNILGAEVATLVDHRMMERGAYVATFDGSNLASGIYFYRIGAKAANGEGYANVKKLMLLK